MNVRKLRKGCSKKTDHVYYVNRLLNSRNLRRLQKKGNKK